MMLWFMFPGAAVWILLTAIVGRGATEPHDFIVTPVSINETRTDVRDSAARKLVPEGWRGEMHLSLEISGPGARDATRWRGMRIEEAVDDLGNSLLPPAPMSQTKPVEQWNSLDAESHQAPRRAIVVATLQPPARRAKRIARLRGEVQLQVGGELKIIRVPKLKSALGSAVVDLVLQAAGLRLLAETPPIIGGNYVNLTLSGDRCALRTADVTDGPGSSMMIYPSRLGSVEPWQINLSRPVDDKMTLEVEILLGQKVAAVPIDLKDIALP